MSAQPMRAALVCLVALAGCTSAAPRRDEPERIVIVPLASGTTAGLRGLSVVDARIAWASGARGSVLRTTDGGATWAARNVVNADSLDFRDIEAFDSLTAFVLSAGEDGRIYRTVDGGRSWQLQYRNQVKGAFFDCFDFWDERHGIAMSDPVGGRFLLVATDDGSNWRPLPDSTLPVAAAGEAAFAASGTCLVTAPPQRVYLATGGGAQARVLVSHDRGSSWRATLTPVTAGAPSAGIFSLAFSTATAGIAIGGDYQNPGIRSTVAVTADGGVTWAPAGSTSYVSGAAFAGPTNTVVAVGTGGTRISADGGRSWVTADTLELNAVGFASAVNGFAVGPGGRIVRIQR